MLPAPIFSEFERACARSCTSQVTWYELREKNNFYLDPDDFIKAIEEKLPTLSFDMVFLCNPNNPTGMLMKRDAVLKIADAARETKSYLIVDEAYIDFCSDESVVKDVERNPYLIVLRSFSGFYSLPGLRFGYGIFPESLMARLSEQREPWTVNSLSQRAAVVALKDKVFRKESLNVIAKEKWFLEKNFKKIGIKCFHSDTHFFLVKMDNAVDRGRQLRDRGILVRNCEGLRGLNSSYIRLVVRSHRENAQLIKALTSILQQDRVAG